MLKLTKASVSVHVEKPGVLTLRLKPPEAPPPFLRPQLSHARHPEPLPYVPRALRPQRTRLRPVVVRPPQSPSQPLYDEQNTTSVELPIRKKKETNLNIRLAPLSSVDHLALHRERVGGIRERCGAAEVTGDEQRPARHRLGARQTPPFPPRRQHEGVGASVHGCKQNTTSGQNNCPYEDIKIHSPAMSSRVASSPSRTVTTSTLAS